MKKNIKIPKNAKVIDDGSVNTSYIMIPGMLGWDIASEIAEMNELTVSEFGKLADVGVYQDQISVDDDKIDLVRDHLSTTYITVKSCNLDFAGEWSKEDVEKEMRDLGIHIKHENEWIDFIFSNFLVELNFENDFDVSVVAYNECIRDITLTTIDGIEVRIIKE